MALGVFFTDRLEAILASLASAGSLRGPEYHAALADVALALALGLEVMTPVNAWRLADVEHQVEVRPQIGR